MRGNTFACARSNLSITTSKRTVRQFGADLDQAADDLERAGPSLMRFEDWLARRLGTSTMHVRSDFSLVFAWLPEFSTVLAILFWPPGVFTVVG